MVMHAGFRSSVMATMFPLVKAPIHSTPTSMNHIHPPGMWLLETGLYIREKKPTRNTVANKSSDRLRRPSAHIQYAITCV
ncbi:uncharacterized protein EI90DRAFT_3031665, partial [Cantharellus anzutake]|uniref:uncharacterized protein n=1 Tax=Cantharellus anzutake TaxID=1750568 RepID=UPI001902F748